MRVELRGIIEIYDGGHKYVDVIVKEEWLDMYVKHRVGVDIKVNRGRILTFLGKLYDMEPGHIVWPHHIVAGGGGI